MEHLPNFLFKIFCYVWTCKSMNLILLMIFNLKTMIAKQISMLSLHIFLSNKPSIQYLNYHFHQFSLWIWLYWYIQFENNDYIDLIPKVYGNPSIQSPISQYQGLNRWISYSLGIVLYFYSLETKLMVYSLTDVSGLYRYISYSMNL